MAEPAQNRDEIRADEKPVRGRPFAPGNRANPGGRPKGLASATRRVLDRAAEAAQAELEERAAAGEDVDPSLAAADGSEILARFWAGVVADKTEKTQDRLAASKLLAERGWGKPPEHAPVETDDPLDWGESELEAASQSFDAKVVDLASRRALEQP